MASSRRGNGEGSIYEVKTRGRWCAAITVYTPVGRSRKWLYGRTRRDVQEKLTLALRAVRPLPRDSRGRPRRRNPTAAAAVAVPLRQPDRGRSLGVVGGAPAHG